LDTSDIVEHMTPTELNPSCIEKTPTVNIMDTKINNTHKKNIQLYWVVIVGQLQHHGNSLTRDKLQAKFPHLMEELNAIGNISS